jgi:hypothetical protein
MLIANGLPTSEAGLERAKRKQAIWFWSIPLLVYGLGCMHSQPLTGKYSGRFDWQDGLKDVTLALESDGHKRLDLTNKEIHDQIESAIREHVERANLRSARGTIAITLFGNSPLAISVRNLKIQVPDFAELLLYVQTQNVGNIRQFVEQYDNVNQRDSPGQRTALYYAAEGPDVKTVRTLIELGADPNIPDLEGDTPLIAAVMANHEDVVRQLIRSGANVNQADQAGGTAVMRAIEMGRPKLLALILQSGADPNQVAPNGQTPLQLARKRGDQSTIAALQQAGASK